MISSSSNLKREWKVSCQRALGFEPLEQPIANEEGEAGHEHEAGGVTLLNLLPDNFLQQNDPALEKTHQDGWMDNAHLISSSLDQIISLLDRKKDLYLEPNQHEEASLLESTILSFCAATANQIESLKQSIPSTSSGNNDYAQHCSGIISYLLETLKEAIAKPFAALQKKRARPAMSLWDEPLQCRLIHDENSQFLPTTDAPRLLGGDKFLESHAGGDVITPNMLKRPTSIFAKKKEKPESTPRNKKSEGKPQQLKEKNLPYQDVPENNAQNNQLALQQEALILNAKLQNDLDSVQQVEARMTEITSLLGQFSDLVSNQAMEITNIHDSTLQSHSNVSKGQDHLIDATQRLKQSRHYMASLVIFMSMLLLFFNYMSP